MINCLQLEFNLKIDTKNYSDEDMTNVNRYKNSMIRKIKETKEIENLQWYSNNIRINRWHKTGKKLLIMDHLIDIVNKKILKIDPNYDLNSEDHLFFKHNHCA